jgi:hypothetical protein
MKSLRLNGRFSLGWRQRNIVTCLFAKLAPLQFGAMNCIPPSRDQCHATTHPGNYAEVRLHDTLVCSRDDDVQLRLCSD